MNTSKALSASSPNKYKENSYLKKMVNISQKCQQQKERRVYHLNNKLKYDRHTLLLFKDIQRLPNYIYKYADKYILCQALYNKLKYKLKGLNEDIIMKERNYFFLYFLIKSIHF